MKKALSNTAVFTVGFVACALALKTLGDTTLMPMGQNQSRQAVLAALNTTPLAMKHFTGDTVVADAAAKVDDAVVTVHTVGKATDQGASDPIMRLFGGGGGDNPGQTHGAGSGVIISSDGYILTNNHVVENTQTVTVNVGNQQKGYDARVVGTDPMTDIAVLKINPKGVALPAAQLGNSDDMRIGDWAIAVGNPLDIGTTVTLGIISAVNRTGLSAEGHSLNSVIQTDAAINPGNSGGALANINGQVIGINEAIYSPTGSYVGIGFAIPINTAKKIAATLIRDGRVIHPYLGVSYAALSSFAPEARQQMGISLSSDDGVVVQNVYPISPAAQAGVEKYDVILEANGQKIADKETLNTIIQAHKPGDALTLLVSRNGHNQALTVTLRERPATFGQTTASPRAPQGGPNFELPFGQP